MPPRWRGKYWIGILVEIGGDKGRVLSVLRIVVNFQFTIFNLQSNSNLPIFKRAIEWGGPLKIESLKIH